MKPIAVRPSRGIRHDTAARKIIALRGLPSPSRFPTHPGNTSASANAPTSLLATIMLPTRFVNTAPKIVATKIANPAFPIAERAASSVGMTGAPLADDMRARPSTQLPSPAAGARAGVSTRNEYATAETAMDAAITPNMRLSGKRTSPERWQTDSKPTKSHGASATIFRDCARGSPPSGENAGAIDCSPPLCTNRQAAKQMTMPMKNATAKAVCTRPANRLRQQTAAPASIAAAESRMSPSDTSKPLTL